MKTDFPEAFYQLFNSPGGVQSTQLNLSALNFPFVFQNQSKGIQVVQLTAYIEPANAGVAISQPISLSIFGQTAVISKDPFNNDSNMLQGLCNLSGPLALSSLNTTIQASGLVQTQIGDILIIVQFNTNA
jgi:hypothetical protein